MEAGNTLLYEVEAYASNWITEQVPSEHAYHDIQHTLNVVAAVQEIGEACGVSDEEMEILILAAWFHDTGYDKGPLNHEERSARYARQYLSQQEYSESKLSLIEDCIMATKMPHNPQTLLERIMCDADLCHLGKKNYWDRCNLVRQELALTKNLVMNDADWIEFELSFILNHQFYTDVAKNFFGKRKAKHIRQLRDQQLTIKPQTVLTVEEIARLEKKKERKKRKKKRKQKQQLVAEPNTLGEVIPKAIERGVESMFANTYRTHHHLGSIADQKANLMLGTCAIIVTLVLGLLIPRFETNNQLIIPSSLLLITSLATIVLATLSTRPRVTKGRFSRTDIKQKKSNLLFFGNFHEMEVEEFQWGMTEMIKDPDFMYGSITRDLHQLGAVLATKYKYLHICYQVFMIGLILTVLSFCLIFWV